jgi:hypothetical protein
MFLSILRPHIYIYIQKIQNTNKRENIGKLKNKYIHQWEKHEERPESYQILIEKDQNTQNRKTLTTYFLLMKALLVRKIQYWMLKFSIIIFKVYLNLMRV